MATFQDLLTFTRGSDGTAYDRFGDLATYGIDTPRFQHDPATLTTSSTTIDLDSLAVGDSVLIDLPGSDTFAAGKDISVTDSADINRYITGVVEFSSAGSVQVTVKTINGTGSNSSWTLIENLGLLIEEQRTRLNTIAAAPTSPENVTVTATAHTISFFGTGTVDLTGVATETLIGTGADERVTLTFTPTAGTLTLTPSGTVTDLQLEEGSFATSVIRGEGSQVTRSADDCSRTLGAEFNASAFTLYGELNLVDADERGMIWTLGTDADRDQIYLFRGAPQGNSAQTIELLFSGSLRSGFLGPYSGKTKIAVSVEIVSGNLTARFAINGSVVSTITGAAPTYTLEKLFLAGDQSIGTVTSGQDRRLDTLYPRAYTATELEALTAP